MDARHDGSDPCQFWLLYTCYDICQNILRSTRCDAEDHRLCLHDCSRSAYDLMPANHDAHNLSIGGFSYMQKFCARYSAFPACHSVPRHHSEHEIRLRCDADHLDRILPFSLPGCVWLRFSLACCQPVIPVR